MLIRKAMPVRGIEKMLVISHGIMMLPIVRSSRSNTVATMRRKEDLMLTVICIIGWDMKVIGLNLQHLTLIYNKIQG